MLESLAKLIGDEEGATALEYGLMAAAVAGVLIVVAYFSGGKVSNSFNNVAQHAPLAAAAPREGSPMSLPIPLLSPLGAGLMWAMVCDLRRRRIPNVVSGSIFVTGLAISGYRRRRFAALPGLAASVLLMLVLYKPWQAGGIGGGDVKLAAAVGAWVGLSHLIWFVLAAAVAGGVVAAVCYLLAPPATRADVRANLVLAGLHGELPPRPLPTARGTSPFLTRSRLLRARLSRFSLLRCKIERLSRPRQLPRTLNPPRGPSMNPMLSVIPVGRDVFQGDTLGHE